MVDATEPADGHQRLRLGLAEDEADLVGAVEVDDRDHGRPEPEAGPQHLERLDPARHLVGDDVAGPETAVRQPRRQTGRTLVQPGRGGDGGALIRPDPDPQVGVGCDPAIDELGERLVGPRPVAQVPLPQLGRC